MASVSLTTDPAHVDVDDATIHADVRAASPAGDWLVRVTIVRSPGLSRLQGREVGASLAEANGRLLSLIEREEGSLVEAGGSLGASTNATFRFEGSVGTPVELRVEYRGREARFRLMEGESPS